MVSDPLQHALASVPTGDWAVGVSGGADSVALLSLLRQRSDLDLHVVHLDHQTRGLASTGDADFVRQLAGQWNLTSTVARRDEIEPALQETPKNRSAFYRALRMTLFQQVVSKHELSGVLLAHHVDDQAETILHRLLHGSGPSGLAGMQTKTTLAGLVVVRPLLGVRRDELRSMLRSIGQSWREDASNASEAYLRNRLRKLLHSRPELTEALLDLGKACRDFHRWTIDATDKLSAMFHAEHLANMPTVLAREAAKQWLVDQGVPRRLIIPACLDQLIEMARDAASPAKCVFPGKLIVRRRQKTIFAEQPPHVTQYPPKAHG